MAKRIYFSDYIDESGIGTIPTRLTNDDKYRYAITIPFKNRVGGSTAVVIMKNPSKAGTQL